MYKILYISHFDLNCVSPIVPYVSCSNVFQNIFVKRMCVCGICTLYNDTLCKSDYDKTRYDSGHSNGINRGSGYFLPRFTYDEITATTR